MIRSKCLRVGSTIEMLKLWVPSFLSVQGTLLFRGGGESTFPLLLNTHHFGQCRLVFLLLSPSALPSTQQRVSPLLSRWIKMASQSSPSVRNHKVPLVPPPPGVVYNLINPASRAYQIHVVSSVFLALMVVFVAIRIYAKWVLQKTRTWDDCTAPSYSV